MRTRMLESNSPYSLFPHILYWILFYLCSQNAVLEITHMNHLTAVWKKHYPNFGSKMRSQMLFSKLFYWCFEDAISLSLLFYSFFLLYKDLGWATPAWKDVKNNTRAFTNFHTELLQVLRANLDRYVLCSENCVMRVDLFCTRLICSFHEKRIILSEFLQV